MVLDVSKMYDNVFVLILCSSKRWNSIFITRQLHSLYHTDWLFIQEICMDYIPYCIINQSFSIAYYNVQTDSLSSGLLQCKTASDSNAVVILRKQKTSPATLMRPPF